MKYIKPYRYVALSLRGFIQQVAVSYVRWGYFFYTIGEIPGEKIPEKTDGKILCRYGLRWSRWSNARAKEQGRASVQYLRFGHAFVIMATAGEHLVREEERLKDVRREPLKSSATPSVTTQGQGSAWVMRPCIQKPIYAGLKAHLSNLASKSLKENHRGFAQRILDGAF